VRIAASKTGPATAWVPAGRRARRRPAEVGVWLAARLLCRGDATRPCGRCPDCRLFLAGSHPDYRWIGVLKDKKEISIDQMRALSESLSFGSDRGGVKVAVIAPAEAMSLKAFNALLKTLEEPADDTFLVLAASKVDRIPKTIMSRTMRLRLPLPGEPEALAWLRQQKPDVDWPALLALARHALPCSGLRGCGPGQLDAEMQGAIAAAVAGGWMSSPLTIPARRMRRRLGSSGSNPG
jgi:hypothetical protein